MREFFLIGRQPVSRQPLINCQFPFIYGSITWYLPAIYLLFTIPLRYHYATSLLHNLHPPLAVHPAKSQDPPASSRPLPLRQVRHRGQGLETLKLSYLVPLERLFQTLKPSIFTKKRNFFALFLVYVIFFRNFAADFEMHYSEDENTTHICCDSVGIRAVRADIYSCQRSIPRLGDQKDPVRYGKCQTNSDIRLIQIQ